MKLTAREGQRDGARSPWRRFYKVLLWRNSLCILSSTVLPTLGTTWIKRHQTSESQNVTLKLTECSSENIPQMKLDVRAESTRGEGLPRSTTRPHSSCLLIERLAACWACAGLWDVFRADSMSRGGSEGCVGRCFFYFWDKQWLLKWRWRL